MKKLLLLAAVALQLGTTRAVLAEGQVDLKRIARISSPADFIPYFNNGQRVVANSEGTRLVTTVIRGDETSLYLYDLIGMKRYTIFQATMPVDSIEMTRDGSLLLITAGNNPREMALIDLKNGAMSVLPKSEGSGVQGHIRRAYISPDGKFVAYTIESSIEEQANVTLHETLLMDLATKKSRVLVSALQDSNDGVDLVMGVSDEGRYVLLEHSEKYGGDRRRLFRLDTVTMQTEEVDSIPQNSPSKNYGVLNAVQSRDGRFIAYTQWDGSQKKIQRRDSETGSLTNVKCPQFGSRKLDYSDVPMSDEGDLLFSASPPGIESAAKSGTIRYELLIAHVDQRTNSCKVTRKRASYNSSGQVFVGGSINLTPGGEKFTYIRSLIDRRLNHYREELVVGAFKK